MAAPLKGLLPTHRQLLAGLIHDLPPCVVWRELSGDAALGGIEEGMNEAERTSLDIDIAAGDIHSVRVFNGRAQFLRRQVFRLFSRPRTTRRYVRRGYCFAKAGMKPLDLMGDVDVVYGTGLVEESGDHHGDRACLSQHGAEWVSKGRFAARQHPGQSDPCRPKSQGGRTARFCSLAI